MSLFVVGTDTGVGKTWLSAALLARYSSVQALRYWKPVQTGFPPDDDGAEVLARTGLSADRLAPPGPRFKEPLSPHRAAELEGQEVTLEHLLALFAQHATAGPLLVEGAGGLLVPLNRRGETWREFLVATRLPVVVAARSGLGTINHTLLTLSELQRNAIPVAGVAFLGPPHPDNVQTVVEMTNAEVIVAGDLQSDVPVDPDGRLQGFLAPH